MVKAAKNCLTLFLELNPKNNFKLNPFLVYKPKNTQAFKNYSENTLPVIWKANPKQ